MAESGPSKQLSFANLNVRFREKRTLSVVRVGHLLSDQVPTVIDEVDSQRADSVTSDAKVHESVKTDTCRGARTRVKDGKNSNGQRGVGS